MILTVILHGIQKAFCKAHLYIFYMRQMNDSFKTKNIQQVTPLVVSQLNQGNVKAFDLIYHAYYVYLCAIAVYYVHDKNVAAELVNDVFVNLWNKKRDVSYPLLPYLRKL